MNYRHCEPRGVDAFVAEMLDSTTDNFDPIEELLEAMKRGQNASITTATIPKTYACDRDKPTVNLVIDHFDEIFEEMATKIIEKAVDDRIGDTAFGIRTILANHKKNAFTVVWEDGESTVIHLQDGDEWDDEKALAMCFVKKLFGNKGSFNYIFTETLPSKLKVIPKEEEKTATISVDTPEGTSQGWIGISGSISTVDFGATTVTDRIDEVEKKVDNVDKKVDDLKSDIKKAGIAAETASNNFAKLVDNIAGTPKEGPSKEAKKYMVYLYNVFDGQDQLLSECNSIEEVNKFVSAEQKKRIVCPGYTRYWSDKTGLYMDYGSHSFYFYIPGLTMEELEKAL